MCRFWFRDRQKRRDWGRQIVIHVVGFILCFGILAVNLYEKFEEGAWVTVLVTGSVVGVFTLIRRHYRGVQQNLRRLDDILGSMPSGVGATTKPIQRNKPTAVLLVGGYAGLGVHSLLTIQRLFPGYFQNFVFLSVGVIDSATFLVDHFTEVRSRRSRPGRRWTGTSSWRGRVSGDRAMEETEVVDTTTEPLPRGGQGVPRDSLPGSSSSSRSRHQRPSTTRRRTSRSGGQLAGLKRKAQ
jgi:hypothetical protein